MGDDDDDDDDNSNNIVLIWRPSEILRQRNSIICPLVLVACDEMSPDVKNVTGVKLTA